MIESMPLLLIGGLLLALMVLAYECASKLVRSKPAGPGGNADDNRGYILSGVFGLLALLMAFAFSLAIGRYEQRRELVVAEANAIGTFASRLALLPQAARADLQTALAAYAQARVAAGISDTQSGWQQHGKRAEDLGDRIDSMLFLALQASPPDTRLPVLVQAYNDMRDRAADRHAAREAHLPVEVLALLALYCVAGASVLGYALDAGGIRHRVAAGIFFALLSCAFVTILDLDRPRGGAIMVPQDELVRISRTLTR